MLRIALVGATMAANAVRNGWAGAIVFGAIRDSDEIALLPWGLKATGTTARKSPGITPHQLNVPVTFGNVTIHSGEWIYADSDAVLVRSAALLQTT